eukprot:sb/3468000/
MSPKVSSASRPRMVRSRSLPETCSAPSGDQGSNQHSTTGQSNDKPTFNARKLRRHRSQLCLQQSFDTIAEEAEEDMVNVKKLETIVGSFNQSVDSVAQSSQNYKLLPKGTSTCSRLPEEKTESTYCHGDRSEVVPSLHEPGALASALIQGLSPSDMLTAVILETIDDFIAALDDVTHAFSQATSDVTGKFTMATSDVTSKFTMATSDVTHAFTQAITPATSDTSAVTSAISQVINSDVSGAISQVINSDVSVTSAISQALTMSSNSETSQSAGEVS